VLILISKCFAKAYLNIIEKTLIIFSFSITANKRNKLQYLCHFLPKQGAKLVQSGLLPFTKSGK
jgi:hypothetical protein